MARATFSVDASQVIRAMDRLPGLFRTEFAKRLDDQVGPDMVVNIKGVTPVLDGDLQSTVRQDKLAVTKDMVLIEIRVGGIQGSSPAQKFVNYAAAVHELGSPRGRGRNFVITPVIATGKDLMAPQAGKSLAVAVRKAR